MKRFLSLVLYSLAFFNLGCALHRKPVPTVWRFDRCAENNGHHVCECSHLHKELNAKTGQKVMVCD